MIENFNVEHFRCFERLELKALRRINVIVGRNAAGKTALLEAIRLGLGGTPGSLWTLNQQRGILVFLQPPAGRDQFEAQWSTYFHNLDSKQPIRVSWTDSDGRQASLTVAYDPTKAVTPTRQIIGGAPPPVTTIIPLKFARVNLNGESSELYATVDTNGQLQLQPGPEIGTATEFFTSNWFYNPQQSAQWFSQLSVQNKETEIIATMRREFLTDIVDLSILAPVGFPVVYGTMPYAPKKLPIALISSGLNKFFSVISALLTTSSGVVLLDEMENGIYYDRLRAFWETLLRVSDQSKAQLFVSTHSWECLQAARESIQSEPDKFSLIRLEHGENGSVAYQFIGSDLKSAIEQEMDVR